MTAKKNQISGLKPLTPKEEMFVNEYVYSYNATEAFQKAFSNNNYRSSAVMANRLLKKVKIQKKIEEEKNRTAERLGLSRERLADEHKKIGLSSIAHLHNTWITRKEFDSIPKRDKDCIKSIDVKIIKKKIYSAEGNEVGEEEVEHVKILLYDKQKSLDALERMLGYGDGKSSVSNVTINNFQMLIQNLHQKAEEYGKSDMEQSGYQSRSGICVD